MATLDDLRREHEDLTQKLANPGRLSREEFARLAARQAELQELFNLAERMEHAKTTIAEHEEALRSDDKELRALAEEELPKLRAEFAQQEHEFQEKLLPPDPLASHDVILEIRAGTGGEEASLFARDLFTMYAKYAEKRGWSVRLVSESRSDLGGLKEVIADIRGRQAYGTLCHESGVHRVQRIPATEKSGRIHTSTVTVAVLPSAAPEEVEMRPQDLRIDTFRASGHGGQHVQKTESAVRITHLPTGMVITCQDERSQHANKERALAVLRARLLAAQVEAHEQAQQETRRKQIGSGERAEKIRTYNLPQDRVTDHRVKQSWHDLERILGGDLDPVVEAVQAAARDR
ncbi:MAG: peptide chain release factor 1 [Parcubacteria group bacterium Gr01-1014_38]|nr:MAG: peptide chain release factor 1 [Parcubacteria group bacterium Gr01-1014_38]